MTDPSSSDKSDLDHQTHWHIVEVCERHDMIMMDVIITVLLLGNLLLQCYSLVSGPTFPSYAGE